ncbi:MAG: FAD:protein FMN transferase [Planctomycetes bacterium]|nr:FAD:protein FMN transferase [Planctomycetota bacterium]
MFVLLLSVAFLSQVPAAGGAAAESARFEYRQIVMGVEARIVLYAPAEAAARGAASAAFARMHAVDDALSDYRQDSELMRLSARAGQGPVAVSEDLFAVLSRGQEIAAASSGAFDVTVGPLVRLWRAARAAGRLPDAAALDAARQLVGFQGVRLDPATRTAELLRAGMLLDAGALGKGYACDCALGALRAQGVEQALVDLGGDLAAGAPPPLRAGWLVLAGAGGEERPLVVSRAGVATSGPSEQFLEADGVRWSHIIDPRTGYGLCDSLGVTVVAGDGVSADALASAASVLGRREGRRVVAAAGASVIFHDPRFTPLFDGETLAGWVTEGGRYDGNALWSVEDGAITGRVGEDGAGGLLYTAKRYASFIVELETWLDEPFDSGVFVRMAPEGKGAQVTLDVREGGEVGAIYADGFLAHNEWAKERFLRNAWNHVEVQVTGFDMRVEAWLNGERISDYFVPPASAGYAPTGLIGLQVHGGRDDPPGNRACFRNVRIRELPLFGADLEGFVPLFSGLDLAGWREAGGAGRWCAQDGVLDLVGGGAAGWLCTQEEFADFRLSLEYQVVGQGSAAVLLRAVEGGGATLRGRTLELGGGACPGEWSRLEVLCQGARLAAARDGVPLRDAGAEARPGEPPGEYARSGSIAFEAPAGGAPGEVCARFRDVRVLRL